MSPECLILIRNCTTNSLFFLLRSPLRDLLPTGSSKQTRFLNDFICGAMLGGLNSSLIYPVNVVKSYQQKQMTRQNQSLISSCKAVLAERDYKIRSIYYGVQLNFTRALITWGIINATYEFCMATNQKQQQPTKNMDSIQCVEVTSQVIMKITRNCQDELDKQLDPHVSGVLLGLINENKRVLEVTHFSLSLSSGGLNSSLIYPVNVVKSYQQKQMTRQNQSLISSCKAVLAERDYKIRSIYYGVQLNFTRALITWGIINATYEFCISVLQPRDTRDYDRVCVCFPGMATNQKQQQPTKNMDSIQCVEVTSQVIMKITRNCQDELDKQLDPHVSGVLLGLINENKRVLEVTHCFPLMNSDTDESMEINREHMLEMERSLRSVNIDYQQITSHCDMIEEHVKSGIGKLYLADSFMS
eukprot:sb/3465109/